VAGKTVGTGCLFKAAQSSADITVPLSETELNAAQSRYALYERKEAGGITNVRPFFAISAPVYEADFGLFSAKDHSDAVVADEKKGIVVPPVKEYVKVKLCGTNTATMFDAMFKFCVTFLSLTHMRNGLISKGAVLLAFNWACCQQPTFVALVNNVLK